MRLLLLWLAVTLFVGAAQAQTRPQAKAIGEGHDLALALCSVCHIAASDQTNTPMMSSPGPPFRVIANRTEVTAPSLRTFLTTTHSTTNPPFTMPNPKLSDRQLDGVIDYILSLRGPT
jgi:mono/diheme cytochrome c family protein